MVNSSPVSYAANEMAQKSVDLQICQGKNKTHNHIFLSQGDIASVKLYLTIGRVNSVSSSINCMTVSVTV